MGRREEGIGIEREQSGACAISQFFCVLESEGSQLAEVGRAQDQSRPKMLHRHLPDCHLLNILMPNPERQHEMDLFSLQLEYIELIAGRARTPGAPHVHGGLCETALQLRHS
jgi:hypothetical protein